MKLNEVGGDSLVRPMYSNPPVHGARVASTLLTDPKLNAQWCVRSSFVTLVENPKLTLGEWGHRLSEVKGMADRIINMRSTLFDLLKEVGSSKDWKHIKSQIGMFAYLVRFPSLSFPSSLPKSVLIGR